MTLSIFSKLSVGYSKHLTKYILEDMILNLFVRIQGLWESQSFHESFDQQILHNLRRPLDPFSKINNILMPPVTLEAVLLDIE